MSTPTGRPVFLDLRRIRMPVMAVVSILHRATGVVMVLSVPLLVYLFDLSLRDERGFQSVMALLGSLPLRLLGVLLAWVLAHHFFAGVRFLLLDLEQGVDRRPARQTAWMVHAAAAITALLVAGGLL